MLESRVYRIAETLFHLLVLNALWLLASLPVVTLVPATAALFGVVRVWQRSGEPSIGRTFLEQFRRHFVRGALLSGPWLVLGAALALLLFVNRRPESFAGWLLFATTSAAIGMYLCTSAYLFPVLVSSELPWTGVVRRAFLLAVSRAPTALLCVVVAASLAAVTLAVPILALWVGSATAFAVYWLCDRTLPGAG